MFITIHIYQSQNVRNKTVNIFYIIYKSHITLKIELYSKISHKEKENIRFQF